MITGPPVDIFGCSSRCVDLGGHTHGFLTIDRSEARVKYFNDDCLHFFPLGFTERTLEPTPVSGIRAAPQPVRARNDPTSATREGGSSRIDPNQIPRPAVAPGQEKLIFETRSLHSANVPPVSTIPDVLLPIIDDPKSLTYYSISMLPSRLVNPRLSKSVSFSCNTMLEPIQKAIRRPYLTMQ
eukprot:2140423-Pyramimonas_sp.AAC.2